MAGWFAGTLDFGGGSRTFIGGTDIFVVKYTSTGAFRWVTVAGSPYGDSNMAPETAFGVAIDGDGNVVVTGTFAGTVNFGGGSVTSAGGWDGFVAKYAAATGAHLWSRRLGGTSGEAGNAVAVDASDNVIVTGRFGGTVDFGGGPRTSAGGNDVFVAKYSATGAHLWSKAVGATGSEVAYGVAVDGRGEIVVTGSFTGTTDLGGGLRTSAGDADLFVAKYASTGTYLWSRTAGGAYLDEGHAVTVDGSDNMRVVGSFAGTLDLGGGPLTGPGRRVFVVKYTPTGAHVWSKHFGSTSTNEALGVAVDGSGNVVLAGRFGGTVDFGGEPLTAVSSENDIFLVQLAP